VKRRTFILGAVAAAVSAALPALPSDGYEYKTVSMGFTIAKEEVHGKGVYGAIGRRYADALAKSMSQTKERVIADVLSRAFEDSGEGARRSIGVEGSPDRI
jgi:hypothetical protein